MLHQPVFDVNAQSTDRSRFRHKKQWGMTSKQFNMLFASESLCKGHGIESCDSSKFFRYRLARFALRNAALGRREI
jgi:hypothetical protein